jgi:hypothetical protein
MTTITPPAGATPEYMARVEDITGRSWPPVITGPGEYRLRNGKRAVIINHARSTVSAFVCEGHVIVREKPLRREWQTWKPNGQIASLGQSGRDIVGPWQP